MERRRGRQRIQDRRQLLLEPWVEDGVRRALHRLGPQLTGGRSEQREQLGRPATNMLVGLGAGSPVGCQDGPGWGITW